MEECMICFEETNEFMFYPCTHKVCKPCFDKLNKCPLCNETHIYIEPSESETRPVSMGCYLCCYGIILLVIVYPFRMYI